MKITTAVYARCPVLADKSGQEPKSAWPLKYWQMVNMTSDSHLFRTRAELEGHADPGWLADPQFWIQPPAGLARAPYALGFKDVTSPTNVRTIAAIIPTGAARSTLPLIELDPDAGTKDPARLALLVANLNAAPFDFVARQKVQSQHRDWFIVREAVLELTYTAHDMAAFASDMGHVDAGGEVRPPFAWDEDRRLRLRAKLDALYFILYGVFDPVEAARDRDDIRYIYSTFPIVEREETVKWGFYRSRDLCLAWINALAAGRPDAPVEG